MYELQSLQDFLESPMGRGTGILPNRDLIINDFKSRYFKMLEKGKEFKTEVYYNNKTDTYYFHIKVPSETERKNTYDVVLELSPVDKQMMKIKPHRINKYKTRFFSNSPSFIYTYAYIMKHNNMLIKELTGKYAPIVLRKEPKTKNPTGTILYEKSITFAIISILEHTEYLDRNYLQNIQKGHPNNLIKHIRTDIDILKEIDDERNKLSQIKRNEKREQKEKVERASREVKAMIKPKKTVNKITPKKSTSTNKTQSTTRRVGAKKSTRTN